MQAALCRKKRLVVIVSLLSGSIGIALFRWTRISDSLLPIKSKIHSNTQFGFEPMMKTQTSSRTTELNEPPIVHTERLITKTPVYSNKQAESTPMPTAESSSRTTEVKRLSPIVYNETCNASINDSRRTTTFYGYDKVQQYMNGLFDNISDINMTSKDAVPIFISACSSNHFHEALEMFENFNSVVRKIIPSARAILYDLGLTAAEKEKMLSVCQCEYRQFPFDMFPGHVKTLSAGYAFKPLVIMMVLKENPFAVWMDASIRFKAANISQLIEDARRLDVICANGDGSIARRTLPTMFAYFGEEPCAFKNLPEIQSGFLIARTTPFVVENILKPWVACALLINCMVPEVSPIQYLYCNQHGNVYGECHRYDQSAWGILLYRAYGYGIVERQQTYGGMYVYVRRM